MVNTIVIVSDSGSINGGNAKVALHSAIELSKRGIRVILFCGTYPIDDEILKSNIEVICLDQKDILNNKNRILAIIQGIWNSVAKSRFEQLLMTLNSESTIIHFHSWSKVLSSSLFLITYKYKFKSIITAHDYFSFCPNGGFFNYKKSIICNCKPMTFKCICCNCDSRKFIHKLWRVLRQIVQNLVLWKNKNITYITISDLNDRIIKENLYKKKSKAIKVINPIQLSNNINVNANNNKYYIFIGRLSSEKGAELFCKALTELKLPGIVLGDGYQLKELKSKYPNINFKGWISRDDMEKYIVKSRALVFPSLWYEGAPLSIIEMKSYGIPCIVSDASSACEEIDNGKNGYIFKSGDLLDLKNKILLIEKSDISTMSKKIINEFDPKIYSVSNHVNNLIDVYNSILSCK